MVRYGSYTRGNWEWEIVFSGERKVSGYFTGSELKMKAYLAEITGAKHMATWDYTEKKFHFYFHAVCQGVNFNTKTEAIEEYFANKRDQFDRREKRMEGALKQLHTERSTWLEIEKEFNNKDKTA
jgi:hypothetical protein